jgi:hypothetical protein
VHKLRYQRCQAGTSSSESERTEGSDKVRTWEVGQRTVLYAAPGKDSYLPWPTVQVWKEAVDSARKEVQSRLDLLFSMKRQTSEANTSFHSQP